MFRPLLLWLLLGGQASGDDLLRGAQQELRARKLYFGPIDGRESAASTAAIRRLQSLKGIDQSGQLDGDTQRALGIRPAASDPLAEKGCALVQQYLAAQMGDDVDREMELFAERIDYFDEGMKDRADLREVRLQENKKWPVRRYTLINRTATANPAQTGVVIITARIRTEVRHSTGQPRVLTEGLSFILREVRGSLRIAGIKRTVKQIE